MGMDNLLWVSDEVRAALDERRAVVALESSLIVNGPAYPANVELGLAIEKRVRDTGAVPATIGIIDGRFVVGMDPGQFDRFAQDTSIPKASARDLGPVLAGSDLGATTVAGTVVVAERSGIDVFSTAGIGGVHRRAQETFDISADLLQFTRTRAVVVCAGAKSILDLDLTAEYLETVGVPVFGYHTDRMPAFCVRESNAKVTRVDDLGLAARAARLHWAVNGDRTLLLTAPIDEADALDGDEIDLALTEALAEADRSGVRGNAISPFLMRAMAEVTAGRSAAATRSVLLSTARVAGDFAVALAATGAGEG